MFGGYGCSGHCGDTWEWNGASWSDRTPQDGGPSPRTGHGLAFDDSRGRAVLFGGRTDPQVGAGCGDHEGHQHGCSDETWEWDGENWEIRTPQDPEGDGAPLPRKNVVFAYDSARKRVVLFGGWSSEGLKNDLWEWNGTSWASRSLADPEGDGDPTPRNETGMAYIPADDAMLLFGGDDGGADGETWLFYRGDDTMPAHVMHAVFSASGAPADAIIRDLTASFYAGGTGYTGETAVYGVNLTAWDEGRWKTFQTRTASNLNGPASPDRVWVRITDPEAISRMFFGPERLASFAVVPLAPNGAKTAEVAVDYAEVVVKYRLPPEEEIP